MGRATSRRARSTAASTKSSLSPLTLRSREAPVREDDIRTHTGLDRGASIICGDDDNVTSIIDVLAQGSASRHSEGALEDTVRYLRIPS